MRELRCKVKQLKYNIQLLPPPRLTLFNIYLTKHNISKIQTNISSLKTQSTHPQISGKFKYFISLLQISNIRKQQFYNKKIHP